MKEKIYPSISFGFYFHLSRLIILPGRFSQHKGCNKQHNGSLLVYGFVKIIEHNVGMLCKYPSIEEIY